MAVEVIDVLDTLFDGRKVARVRVTATVQFEAYAFVDDPETGEIGVPTGRVEHEIADAVQYRAPHLSDSEDADALIANTEGGSADEDAVKVDAHVEVLGMVEDLAVVVDAIESTEAWM